MAVAVGFGASAVPASADHSCSHSISQAIKEAFGSKAKFVKAVNEANGTDITVADLNAGIAGFCANQGG